MQLAHASLPGFCTLTIKLTSFAWAANFSGASPGREICTWLEPYSVVLQQYQVKVTNVSICSSTFRYSCSSKALASRSSARRMSSLACPRPTSPRGDTTCRCAGGWVRWLRPAGPLDYVRHAGSWGMFAWRDSGGIILESKGAAPC